MWDEIIFILWQSLIFGDFCQIRPTPDNKWGFWDDDNHTPYCGRIGKITHIVPDLSIPNNREEDLIFIEVFFNSGIFDDDAGTYQQFFKKRHLIKKTKYEFEQSIKQQETENSIQEFEEIYKNKRDQIFRHIFLSEEDKDKEALKEIRQKILEETNKFEDDTEEIEYDFSRI